MCKDLVAVCTLEKIDLRGLIHQNEQCLLARKRKGRSQRKEIVESEELVESDESRNQ